MIRILAIDPSLRNTGVALATADTDSIQISDLRLVQTEAATTKQVRKNSDDLRCARQIVDELRSLYRAWKPVVTIVEVPSGTQSARASWTLGVMLGIIAGLPHPVVEVSPTEVKKFFAGNKAASKETMIDLAVGAHPGLPWLRQGDRVLGKNEHLADAVAIAHTGVNSVAFKELYQMTRVAA